MSGRDGVHDRLSRLEAEDPYKIIPRGVSVATVIPMDFQIRTILEYDVRFMQDQVRSEAFVNGIPCGVYAVAAVDDSLFGPIEQRQAVERYRRDLEAMVVKEFMGLDHRKKIGALETQNEAMGRQIEALAAKVAALQAYNERDRWWQFRPVRREWNLLRNRIASAIAP